MHQAALDLLEITSQPSEKVDTRADTRADTRGDTGFSESISGGEEREGHRHIYTRIDPLEIERCTRET